MKEQSTDLIANSLGEAMRRNTGDLLSKVNSLIDKDVFAMSQLSKPTPPALMESQIQRATIKEPWHQLIIIGNGFDLECGLRSSFGHFITSRNEYFANANSDAEHPTFHKTIWDYILAEGEGANWCDVEGAIAGWVAPKDTRLEPKAPLDLSSKLTVFGKTLKKLGELGTTGYGISLNQNETPDRVASYLFKRFYNKGVRWTKGKLLEISYEDLRIYENDFASYLRSEIEQSADYEQTSEELLKGLMHSGLPSTEYHKVDTCALSFNYTKPHKLFTVDGDFVSYVNIHGQLGGEIVFGIDGTGRMSNLDALPYTKTYRLMALDVPNMGSIVPHNASRIFDGTAGIIKFYGHSLGEADYSYFQAIFDAVNLYEGQTSLWFFVRPYKLDGTLLSEEAVRKEMMGKVIRLLDSYGTTLDNKDHGKNLIHKLLIEGRLSIKVI